MIKNTTAAKSIASKSGGLIRLQDPQVRDAETVQAALAQMMVPQWHPNVCGRGHWRAQFGHGYPTMQARREAEEKKFAGYRCCSGCDNFYAAQEPLYWEAKKAWDALDHRQREEAWTIISGYYQ